MIAAITSLLRLLCESWDGTPDSACPICICTQQLNTSVRERLCTSEARGLAFAQEGFANDNRSPMRSVLELCGRGTFFSVNLLTGSAGTAPAQTGALFAARIDCTRRLHSCADFHRLAPHSGSPAHFSDRDNSLIHRPLAGPTGGAAPAFVGMALRLQYVRCTAERKFKILVGENRKCETNRRVFR